MLDDLLLLSPRRNLRLIMEAGKIGKDAVKKEFAARAAFTLGLINIHEKKEALELFNMAYEIFPHNFRINVSMQTKDLESLLKLVERCDEKEKYVSLPGLIFALWQLKHITEIQSLFLQVKNKYSDLWKSIETSIATYDRDSDIRMKKGELYSLEIKTTNKSTECEANEKPLRVKQQKAAKQYEELASRIAIAKNKSLQQLEEEFAFTEIKEDTQFNFMQISVPTLSNLSLDACISAYQEYIEHADQYNKLLATKIKAVQELLEQYLESDTKLTDKEKELDAQILQEITAYKQYVSLSENGIVRLRKHNAAIEKEITKYNSEHTMPDEVAVTVSEYDDALLPSLKQHHAALQQEKQELEKRQTKLQAIATACKNAVETKNASLVGQAQNLKNELAGLVREYNFLSGENVKAEELESSFAAQPANMQTGFSGAGIDEQKALMKEQEAYQKRVESLNASVEKWKKKVADAKVTLQNIKQEIKTLTDEIKSLRDNKQQLAEQIRHKRNEASILRPIDKLPATVSLIPPLVPANAVAAHETQIAADAAKASLAEEKSALEERKKKLQEIDADLQAIIDNENKNRKDAKAFYSTTHEQMLALQKELLKTYHQSTRFRKSRFKHFDYEKEGNVAKAIAAIVHRSSWHRKLAKRFSSSANNQMLSALEELPLPRQTLSANSECSTTGCQQYEALFSSIAYLQGSPRLNDLRSKSSSDSESVVVETKTALSTAVDEFLQHVQRVCDSNLCSNDKLWGIATARANEAIIEQKIAALKNRAQP